MTEKGDFAKVVRAAKEQGWIVERTAEGHLRFLPPDPAFPPIFTGTPKDRGALSKHLRRMRAAGFVWPWPLG